MKTKWYARKNDTQGLIIEEETGRNIAVSYDTKDSNMIACAPERLEAIRIVYSRIANTNIHTTIKDMQDTWDILRQALELDKEF